MSLSTNWKLAIAGVVSVTGVALLVRYFRQAPQCDCDDQHS